MNAEKFGKYIADQRKALGMTQSDLGSILKVTDKAVSKWERGLGFPDINTMVPLAEALHVSIDELMRAEKNITKEVSNEAILNTISIADEQLKKAERRGIIRSIAVIAVITLLLLVGENSKTDSLAYMGLYVYVPVNCALAGFILLLRSIFQKRKEKPYKRTLIAGLILIGIDIAIIAFFLLAGLLAFPGQQ